MAGSGGVRVLLTYEIEFVRELQREDCETHYTFTTSHGL